MLRCGLLGRKLGHSYSPQIHRELSCYEYKLYEKEPEELEAFLKSGTFDGLNVTIPYKKTVMAYLDEISPEAAAIGSVNTIVNRGGKLTGYNTDAFGFSWLLQKSGVEAADKKALVFGSGGASVTVCHVLKSLGADPVVVISRTGENNYENLDRHLDAKLLINATPLGMYPNNGESPVDLTRFSALDGVLDVVYNPARTALMLQAEQLGIPHASGLSMLVAQAKKACEYFTGNPVPDAEIDRIERLLSRQMENIILIGMPGCGKSTFLKLLRQKLRRKGACRRAQPDVSRCGRGNRPPRGLLHSGDFCRAGRSGLPPSGIRGACRSRQTVRHCPCNRRRLRHETRKLSEPSSERVHRLADARPFPAADRRTPHVAGKSSGGALGNTESALRAVFRYQSCQRRHNF